MQFSGTFELADTTVETVWLALSDPVLIERSLPGCQFLVRVDDTDVDFDALRESAADRTVEPSADPDVIAERAFEEGAHYAALIQISVGPVNPTFETVVTIDHREFPEMTASGEGGSGDSSFEMDSWMSLSASEDGVEVEWRTDAEVFGKVAQIGQRVINPVSNRIVKRFFTSVQDQLHELGLDDDAVADASDDSSGRSLVDKVFGRSGGTEES